MSATCITREQMIVYIQREWNHGDEIGIRLDDPSGDYVAAFDIAPDYIDECVLESEEDDAA